ncbi:MAG: TonB-dependent receptor [Reichenbachiella sp.]|uniref:SusC/RagA family TonB-linked outer membrane protein n=1 Tax=Reichenbachiella sp. TaxID=2184521 RepID=UPI0032639B33
MKKLFTGLIMGICILASQQMYAQSTIVKGKVTDNQDGSGLPGVSVLVKGTANGTVTDFDGNYSIEVEDGTTLVFSYIGFISAENAVSGRSTIDVAMSPDLTQLDEVVVIGYGTVKKQNLTGSISKVAGSDLPQIPTAHVEAMLQGKVPGLQVTSSSGEPGSNAIVQLRGGSSFGGNNAPMIIVDGFPIGGAGELKQISPQDIESVEVLKDAATTAIYGTRAANGLIVITTKKGKRGRNSVDITAQSGVTNVLVDKLDLIKDPVTYATLANEVAANDSRVFELPYDGGIRSGTYYPSVAELESNAWPYQTNWIDFVYRPAVTNNVNVAFSGGNDKTQFRLSGTYFDQEGTVIGNDYNKISAAINLQQQVLDNLKITGDLKMSFIKDNNSSALNSVGRSPIFPVYNEDGTLFFIGQDNSHPVVLSEQLTDKSKGYDVIAQAGLEWDILEYLKLSSNIGMKLGNSIADRYFPITTLQGRATNGRGELSNYDDSRILSETYLTFNKEVADGHELNVVAGVTYQNTNVRESKLIAEQFVNDALANQDLSTGELQNLENSQREDLLISQFGRINYVLYNRYVVSFTGRRDGYNHFSENNKWGFFPSAAVAWKLHEESFMSDLSVINQFKLRASYGSTGNIGALSPYSSLNLYAAQKYPNGTQNPGLATGFGPDHNIFGNPDLKWETTTTFDVGVDISLFNNSVGLTLDYYIKNTSDLLREEFLPYSSLYDKILINDGEIENKGWEVELSAAVFSKGAFKWDVSANAFFNKNTLKSINQSDRDGIETGPYLETFRDNPTRLQVGQPTHVIWGFRTEGIIQDGETYDVTGLDTEEYLPGEFKYVDLNDDGVIDENDKTIVGNTHPDVSFGITNNFEYKGFYASILMTGAMGADIFNVGKFSGSNQINRWTADNPTQDYPSLRGGRESAISDWWVEDGSYLRVSNVTLGYNVNTANINGIGTLSVYVNADNLAVITGYSGYDPEIANGDVPNIDYGSYPKSRTFSLGLKVSFE